MTPANTGHIEPETLAAADASQSGELRAEQRELSACVQGFLGELPDNYRAVLLLRDAHGLSTPEIAELLSDTSARRTHTALRTSLTTACEFPPTTSATSSSAPSTPTTALAHVSLEPLRSS